MQQQNQRGSRKVYISLSSLLIMFLIPATFLSGLTGCGRTKTTTSDSTETGKPFFPVTEYFATEIANVDSANNIIMKLSSNGSTIDSVSINDQKFDTLAEPFLALHFSGPAIKRLYRQDIFLDLSTNSYNFTYTALKDTLKVQYLHILVDTMTATARRVFINERYQHADTTISRKMGWKTGEAFYINTIFQIPGRKDSVTQLSVKWMK